MPLQKIRDFDPDYRRHFDNQDLSGFDLYSGNEKIGSVDDLLVDDDGRFRYLVVNTGLWIFGKKFLLPIGRTRIDENDRRVYVDGLTREQVENLPEYTGTMPVNPEHERQVRDVYHPLGMSSATERPVNRDLRLDDRAAMADQDSFDYGREPALYDLNDRDHQKLKLYEERLITDKRRQKTGEVIVGKHVETDTKRVEVPIEKERVVIERTTPTDMHAAVGDDAAAFNEGEVARLETYEETPEIRKEAFVREEVNVRKEVDRDVATAEDQIRREQLDLDTEGQTVVERQPDALPNDRP